MRWSAPTARRQGTCALPKPAVPARHIHAAGLHPERLHRQPVGRTEPTRPRQRPLGRVVWGAGDHEPALDDTLDELRQPAPAAPAPDAVARYLRLRRHMPQQDQREHRRPARTQRHVVQHQTPRRQCPAAPAAQPPRADPRLVDPNGRHHGDDLDKPIDEQPRRGPRRDGQRGCAVTDGTRSRFGAPIADVTTSAIC
jgi:hypothetical protein